MNRKQVIDLIDKLEDYPFECEAGSLKMCADWSDLKDLVWSHMHVNRQDGSDICAECGHDLRHASHFPS